MCGRYASSRSTDDLVAEFDVVAPRVAAPLAPDWNVAPTKEVYAVLERPPRPEDGGGDGASDGAGPEPERQLRVLRWGLVPSWAKDPSIGNRMINARRETVAEKPAFRRAFAARRCLVPADGYFEWYPTSQTTKAGKPRKQPFFIRPRDGGVLAMAGLYEIWRDPSRAEDDPERFRWTCTVLTTEAEDALGRIHDRMPLMVERDRWSRWLDPRTDAEADLLDLLAPAAPGRLEAFPVATTVSNVRNNGPELVAPLPLDEVPSELEDAVVTGAEDA
ncbi:SOS response-associated peptidase [Nocardioides perillae]|uniref:Abasic site processing protein n=1 Tax=Nocardioides perillae TaxID=1119534 RepID=A0A7Y9UKH7_9ACTN|nr:SOS response-associated peptidase [Nocardioides perillae]NYG55393.1 putative SOS response-associated peptidase YedK [Nocardioides perillae]